MGRNTISQSNPGVFQKASYCLSCIARQITFFLTKHKDACKIYWSEAEIPTNRSFVLAFVCSSTELDELNRINVPITSCTLVITAALVTADTLHFSQTTIIVLAISG
uniref:Uncharacterized protein n=1 Tax=Pseudictyota dubia TaxID=2749911 RepID=A0A7R9W7F6_9STRA